MLRNMSWAHFRSTMLAGEGSRNNRITIPGMCWADDDGDDGGDGGGGGEGEGGKDESKDESKDDGKKSVADVDPKTAARDAKLASEAAKWRTSLRTKEAEFETLKTTSEASIASLSAEIEELKAASVAEKDDAKDGKPKDYSDDVRRLTAQIKKMEKDLKDERATLTEERGARKTAMISNAISEILAEGKFKATKALGKLLREHMVVDNAGKVVFNALDDDGDSVPVPANLENIMKYGKGVVDDFDSFVASSGASGSGSRGGAGSAASGGLDLEKIRSGDVAYAAKHHEEIKRWRQTRQQ